MRVSKSFIFIAVGSAVDFFSHAGKCAYVFVLHTKLDNRAWQSMEHTANLAEKLYHDQTKAYLREIVGVQSNLIDKNLRALADDVEDIADSVEEILKNQTQYLPRYLPSPRREPVPFGKAYIDFTARRVENLSPEVKEELYRVSNIEDVMIALTAKDYSDKYSDFTVVLRRLK